MTETKETEGKKPLRLSRPGRLELKKTVQAGQVRQSFSHGRSKAVTVEVKRKRTYAPGAGGRMAEVKESASTPRDLQEMMTTVAAEKSKEGRALTAEERAARVRALQDAIHSSEHGTAHAFDATHADGMPEKAPAEAAEPQAAEPQSAAPEAAPVESVAPESVPVESPPPPAEAAPKAERESRQRAEEEARRRADEEARQLAEAQVRGPGGASMTLKSGAAPKAGAKTAAEVEKEEAARGKRARPDGRRLGLGDRRGEPRRRSGKLTITQALMDDGEERVRSLASVRRARERERQRQREQMAAEAKKVVREVVIPESLTVQELANRMAERGADVVKALMKMGVMATINQVIDADTAELLVTEFGHQPKRVAESDVELGIEGPPDDPATLQPRAPVVTVMGHVDHGKTSLLDALRQTDVASREAGGITQHIGAYQVETPNGARITFLDTPGHEAFTAMRARGAKVTDIVILVVAADDSIQPQTVEAINHAKAAEVPIVVAINKIDKKGADPERVRRDLLQHDVVVEQLGGDVLCVEVSAKEHTNLDKMVEAVLLQAELLELKANPDRPGQGVIIEAKLERGRGPVATVLIQRGTVRVGDVFIAGTEWGRVRALIDDKGRPVDSAGPSVPVEVLGLNGTPSAGDDFTVVDNEAQARGIAEYRQRQVKKAANAAAARGTVEQMFTRIAAGEAKEMALVVKADVQGSVEAIVGSVDKLGTDEVAFRVLHSGVGGINESDVALAKASDALIIGFNVRANPQARELAQREKVEIRYYSVIYEIIDDLKAILSGMLAPRIRETLIGSAEIREVFSITKVGKVAGCMVTRGTVRRGAKVRLLRDDVVVYEGKLASLKRFKDEVREVKEGYECGMAFENFQDIKTGDVVECFEVEEVARQL